MIVDTGEISAIGNQDKYLAAESGFMRYFFRHSAKFNVEGPDELNHRLASINLKTEDVKLVVLTHLHLDHTDGLMFFPRAEIMVGEYEYKHPNGNMPTTYPSWFKPNPVVYKKNRIDIFGEAFPITSSGDLLYIPTPGHTAGHSSVVFKTDDFDIIFGGDISYNQEQVLKGELAGVNADYAKSGKTYKNLMNYASAHKTIYLPTHDGNAGNRLMNKLFLVN
jgi:N-acyl homoserine lactone hydrolase